MNNTDTAPDPRELARRHDLARIARTLTPRCPRHPAFEADYCPVCGTAVVIGGNR